MLESYFLLLWAWHLCSYSLLKQHRILHMYLTGNIFLNIQYFDIKIYYRTQQLNVLHFLFERETKKGVSILLYVLNSNADQLPGEPLGRWDPAGGVCFLRPLGWKHQTKGGIEKKGQSLVKKIDYSFLSGLPVDPLITAIIQRIISA